jgi:probable HAF family extracellular repeat protein
MLSLLRRMFSQPRRKKPVNTTNRRWPVPRLEVLEDRCLLSYAITDLGTLGGTDSSAYGINASSQVVGGSYTATSLSYHTSLYDGTATPAMQDLGTLGGSYSFAYGINASGQVAGDAYTAGDTVYHAFLYDGTATPAMHDLGTLGGTFSRGLGINASGQVAGWADIAGNVTNHAFLYDATATPAMQDLGTLGGTRSYAYGINDSGQVVGEAQTVGNTADHAFLYDATATPAMQDLGTLGGSYSVALGINASGLAFGFSNTAGEAHQHAFLYDATATPAMQDLGTLGGSFSQARGINASGQVVGRAYTPDNARYHAFLYDGTAMQDLDGQIPSGSGWVLYEARGINDSGQIVGDGLINGHTHAFLLTPDAGPRATPAGHGMPATLSALSATATPSFFVSGGSVLAPATLAGAEIIGNSLADGNYTLTNRADLVHDAAGPALATDTVISFYRPYGDTQGHRTVDATDVAVLFGTFGKHAGDDGFVSYLDYNGDGAIDDTDLYAFIARYGTTLDP